jgi:squalene/oxidosqualene cyclase-like protein
MKMQGYNGSQCWDTSFAARAMAEGGLTESFPTTVQQIWSFLERTQILSTDVSLSSPAAKYESLELRKKYFRHVSQGGWPFSTSAHGWPISDCTSEGLKAVLVLRRLPCIVDGIEDNIIRNISDERLYDGINVVLTMQNDDGGWATYENTRGSGWYEGLNPSEVFGEIMIDYSYVECTSASLCCLVDFKQQFPNHRTSEVNQAIKLGRSFVRAIQRPDGSWYGSWACCFTYGTWFGIEALVYGFHSSNDSIYQSKPVVKAVEFLLSKQNDNGGWGEDFTSCYDKSYAINGAKKYGTDGSSIVQTSWALLALLAAKCKNIEAISRGAKFLQQMQTDNGDWPQEGISGVFNRACGITYTQYRNVFCLWALGRYSMMTENSN